MRVFIAVLVLIFSLQSWTKADDIRDFEIEGMSIGDSALKYFTKEELNSSKVYHWPNKKFVSSGGWLKNSDSYESWQIFYKDKDEKYIIHYLSGLTSIEDLETCNKKKNEVVNDIKASINETKFIDLGKAKHPGDKTGKSLSYKVLFKFGDNSTIMVTCTDYSDEYLKKNQSINDNFNVSFSSVEFSNFLEFEAYN